MRSKSYAKACQTRSAMHCSIALVLAASAATSVSQVPSVPFASSIISAAECTAVKIGSNIPVNAIGEPVAEVRLLTPIWREAKESAPASCQVDGEMLPVSTGPHAQSIHFRVMLPSVWRGFAIQFGGGGTNGVLPRLEGTPSGGGTNVLGDGAATYGSDSGHTMADLTWALDDEAIKNLAYMQMKKTHDAAVILIQRMYGSKPRFNYYAGNSQGGREALTVAQRYPQDYDGITAGVPIVNFSALMLAPVLIRIQEKPLASWVPPLKGRAIAAEFMRQCDGLDGSQDGVIDNYQACRQIFNLTLNGGKHPWAAKQCSGDVDPDPNDSSAAACLTSAQIKTLEFDFSSYKFPQPYANGVTTFGAWVSTMSIVPGLGGFTPSGIGGPGPRPPVGSLNLGGPGMDGGNILSGTRFKGQEGAAANAPIFTHLGVLGSIGFIMQDLNADPLDYVEGGKYLQRRLLISSWMDATNPDLSAFKKRGGKLLITIGTDDTIASSGSQLDYYQSILNKMGRPSVDTFLRMWVMPQAGHFLTARSYVLNGKGEAQQPRDLPNVYDRVAALRDWVEKGVAPPKSPILTSPAATLPLCSYPEYPRYHGGDVTQSASYTCTAP